MRVGIVGAGSIFDLHAQAYQALGVPIEAVADLDLERATAKSVQFGVPCATQDWRAVVARPGIDLIDVCTPPQFHTPVVLAALEAGKHVVCEKPLATNLAEVDRIVQAAMAARVQVTVVHQLRFNPLYQRLKWLVEQGHLGPTCFARLLRYDPPPTHLVKQGVWGNWQLTGGGVLMTKLIHQLDLLLWLVGGVRRVQALMGTYLFPIESEDHIAVNMELASGALASVCASSYPYGYREELDLVGDKGTAGVPWNLHFRAGAASVQVLSEMDRLFPIGAPWKRKLQELFGSRSFVSWFQPKVNYHQLFLRGFLDAVEGRGPLPVTLQEARRAVELCTAIYTAALTGETVELPLDASATFYEGVSKNDYAAAP
jgi:predicted dehydrogenase